MQPDAVAGRPDARVSAGAESAIIDLDGEPADPHGNERRRTMVLAFAIALALGSPVASRDGPEATAPVEETHVLALPARTPDAYLATMPERLVNEPLPREFFVVVPVRGRQGLAARIGSPGGVWVVFWTENGMAYWLGSERRDMNDLLQLAGSLR
jgi:hypothetical protein